VGQSCQQLAQLNLPNPKITSAETVAAGTFTLAADMTPSLATFYKQLPAFCRVKAVATPSADSDINIEVWLPGSGWNGKFRGQGTDGFLTIDSVDCITDTTGLPETISLR
jgi:feruloyl esterase